MFLGLYETKEVQRNRETIRHFILTKQQSESGGQPENTQKVPFFHKVTLAVLGSRYMNCLCGKDIVHRTEVH